MQIKIVREGQAAEYIGGQIVVSDELLVTHEREAIAGVICMLAKRIRRVYIAEGDKNNGS